MRSNRIFLGLMILCLMLSCARSDPFGLHYVRPQAPDKRSPATQKEVVENIERYKKQIEQDLPFKEVLWETVTPGENITRLTQLADFLYVETDKNRLYAIKVDTGFRQWELHLEAPIDFIPCVVTGVPEEAQRLKQEIDSLSQQMLDETLKKGRSEDKVRNLKNKLHNLRESFRVLEGQDIIYFVSNRLLHCLSRLTGRLLWREKLDFIPSTRPVAMGTAVFMGSVDWNRIYKFDVLKRYASNWFGAGGEITSAPIYHDPSVYFASNDGLIYCYHGVAEDKKWSYPTEKAVKADLIIGDDDTIYVGSTDFAFYAIDRHTGVLKWKFETGNPIISRAAMSLKKVVKNNRTFVEKNIYFRVENDGLYCLLIKNIPARDARNVSILLPHPELKWKFEKGKKFFMDGSKRVYLLGLDNRTLYALSPEKGEVKKTYSLKTFPFRATNHKDKTVYLGTEDGYIFAVKELKTDF